MSDEEFFDTNVIAYAFDAKEPVKNKIAAQLLLEVSEGKRKGVLSNQILFELFLALTKKLKKPLTEIMGENLIEGFIESVVWKKVNYTHETIKEALQTVDKHKTPFVDAVIASTMVENGITKIYTENVKDFKKVPGIVAINPFKR